MGNEFQKGYIAIIEDEADIRTLVSHHLKKNSFDVESFERFEYFNVRLLERIPDVIILDLMLPDADGFDICKNLKNDNRYANIPVIILTAKSEETDKIIGLELGADDYITKPFSPRELVARVKAVLRRYEKEKKTKNQEENITIGTLLRIDQNKYEVYVEGVQIDITPTEFKILSLLAAHKGWVLSREQILEHLWGNEKIVVDRTVDVHMKHLRDKLGPAGDKIKNIRGIGYKLDV